MKVEYLHSGSVDCPLIRIFGTNRNEAILLYEAVLSLAGGTVLSVSTDEIFGVEASVNCSLVMCLGETDQGSQELCGDEFKWTLTGDGWELVAELLSTFTDEASVGSYQWIGGEKVGEVSILFSFSEGGQW